MGLLGSFRFRLLLDVAKQAIYVVDGVAGWAARRSGRGGMRVPAVGKAVVIPRVRGRGRLGGLAGWLVEPEGKPESCVLILHGIGDRMEYWRRAQAFLAQEGIASLVFHYSGYAGSGGTTTPENLEEDGRAAYAWLVERMGARMPVFVLGFSLGTGLAVRIAGELEPRPAGLVLCQAYTSLREAGRRMGREFGWLSVLLPDVWRTVDAVRGLKMPLLVVHGSGDTLFPLEMAARVYEAARAAGVAVTLTMPRGYEHNAAYLHVPEDYWEPIVEFFRRDS